MDMITLTPERTAQLVAYAERRGKVPAARDDAVAAYLEWERRDPEEAVEGVRQGYTDVHAGHTRPAAELHAGMRQKHGISG